MPLSQPMAIASILGTNISGNPPPSKYISSVDPHAARAAQVPSPEINPTSPVEDPALPVTDAKLIAAATLLQVRHEYVGHNVYEDSLAVTEGGPSACSAAESLLKLRTEVDAILLKTSTEHCECGDFHNGDVTFCEHANCLSDISPPAVAELGFDEGDNLYSSESDDGDPLDSAVARKAVRISCHDTRLLLHAREGNALFELPRRRHEKPSSLPCRRCERLQDASERLQDVSLKSKYVEGYRKLGCRRPEGEDTISPEDDVAEDTKRGQHSAPDDTTEPKDPAMSSPRPKLRLVFKKSALEKSNSHPEPESSSSDTSASDSDDADDPPPSTPPTPISPPSPPPTRPSRPKNGITPSPLKQVENASSPAQRDPPLSAKAKGKRPLHTQRDRTNLRSSTGQGRDLANDVDGNGVPESLALPAGGGAGKEVAVTDAAGSLTSRPRTRAQGRRTMAREEGSMPPPSPPPTSRKRKASHLQDEQQQQQQQQTPPPSHRRKGKVPPPPSLPPPTPPPAPPPTTNPWSWSPNEKGDMVRRPLASKWEKALAEAETKEEEERQRKKGEAWGMNGGYVSIFPKEGGKGK